MKDVAVLADVSLMTVSRVLNKDPKGSEETRNRVMAAVEKLNYRVNVSARSFVRHTILFDRLFLR